LDSEREQAMSDFIGNLAHEGGNDAVGGGPRSAGQHRNASNASRLMAAVTLLALGLGAGQDLLR